jgi:hypothetical protein
MKIVFKFIFLAAILLLTEQCKKEEPTPETPSTPETPVNPTENMVNLGETYIPGTSSKATVYSLRALFTGYNEIYAVFTDSVDGSKLNNGHFRINPVMDMGTMQHSTPVENSEDSVAVNNLFKSAVVFSMPGNSQQWNLKLFFHNHKNNKTGTGTLGVNVTDSNPLKLKTTTLSADSNAAVLISILQPSAPKVGINDIEFTIHKNKDNNNYPAVTNYVMEIEPNMPSMGHGSPNNVNPVHTQNGHYKGKVNFTMTGLWQIKLKLYKNGNLISSDQSFEMTLQ